ncbi:MAG TPA: nuclear transport factor 2 family protein [Gemmatimonadaceae bacterium]|nr:nuclear transport factor 2 family protein [Gemmatimonadaceae bacterium]
MPTIAAFVLLLASLAVPRQQPPQQSPQQPPQRRAPATAQTRDREMRLLLDRVRRALLAQDTATLARLWSPAYTFTAPNGALYERGERLEAVMGDGAVDMPDLLPVADARTRAVGNVIVLRTRHSRDGAEATRAQIGDVRMLTVVERRQGRWRILAQQATRVAGR